MSLINGMRVEAAERIKLRAPCGPSSTSRISFDGPRSTGMPWLFSRVPARCAHWPKGIDATRFGRPPRQWRTWTFRAPPSATTLPQASEGSEIVTDYRAMGFTLGRHPLELLRGRLRDDRRQPARELAQLHNGQFARACGIVTVRQRPGTAKGLLFIKLEDETGQTNVSLARQLERYRREALGASLLAVYGVWQTEGKVHLLMVKELRARTELLGRLTVESHDFH